MGQEQRPADLLALAATFGQRLRAGIVDGLVLILVNVPFAALAELSQASFTDRKVQLVLGSIAFILYVFYMSLMLSGAGQTIGMMVAQIVAVDARSSSLPGFRQALRRALGALLAAAPAGLGFLVPALDAQRRSLSDMLSGTRVKLALTDELRAPWLYHPLRS